MSHHGGKTTLRDLVLRSEVGSECLRCVRCLGQAPGFLCPRSLISVRTTGLGGVTCFGQREKSKPDAARNPSSPGASSLSVTAAGALRPPGKEPRLAGCGTRGLMEENSGRWLAAGHERGLGDPLTTDARLGPAKPKNCPTVEPHHCKAGKLLF